MFIMSPTLIEFKDWLENGVNYMGSDRKAADEIYLSLNRGPMAKFWKVVVRRVRSRNVVAHIRGNLQLEKHRDTQRQNELTSSVLISDQTENDERQDLHTQIVDYEKKLSRNKIEFSNISHQTVSIQKNTFEGWQNVENLKSFVLRQSRAGIAVEKEIQKYSVWIKSFQHQDEALESWMSSVSDVGREGADLMSTANSVFEELKKIILFGESSCNALSELDKLKEKSPICCKAEILQTLRKLTQTAEADMFSRLNRPFNLTAENTVEKSLINLRQRHLECHKTILEIKAKKKSLIEQTDKHLLTLRSSLNDQPISKDLIIYLVQLSQMKVAAESMLINIVSKLGSLNNENENQSEILERIDEDFSQVNKLSKLISQKGNLIENLFNQISGLDLKIKIFENLVQCKKLEIKFSIPFNLRLIENFPLNFLSEIDDSSYDPKTLGREPCVFKDELTINRFSIHHPDLNGLFNSLGILFPACPDRVISSLLQKKQKFLEKSKKLEKNEKLLRMIMETSDMKKSKSEMLKSFIKTIHQGRDELLTKFLVSFNTKDWDVVRDRVLAEIEDFRLEPVKDIVRHDQKINFKDNQKKSLSKWYQEFQDKD